MNSRRNPLLHDSLRTQLDGHRQKSKPLPRSVQRALEHSLGADLSQVRVHEDSTLTESLGAEAFAVGADLFFAPGAYQPMSDAGLRLLAHEVEHAIQQRNAQVTGRRLAAGVYVNTPRDAWEQAADRAAERALAGRPAPARYNAPIPHPVNTALIIQRHSSFEHRLLGDAPTDELVAISQNQPTRNQKLTMERDFLALWQNDPDKVNEQMIAAKCPWIRTLRLKASGILVTYGELNTLPDYLPNHQSLDTYTKDILLPILQFVRQEGWMRMNSMLGNMNPPPIPGVPLFKDSVSSFSYTGLLSTLGSTSSLDDLTANLGIKKSDHYKGLLGRNACHFAPFSWYRWQESYLIARNEAQLAYQNRNDSGLRELHTHNAWVAHGYADHFLEDSFAAGHLINKNLVMQWFLEWANTTTTVTAQPWDLTKRMFSSIQPGLAGRNLYASTWQAGPSNDAQTVEEQSTYAQRVAASRLQADGKNSAQDVYHNNYMAFLNSTVTQSASAALHDYHNENSLWVSSASQPNAFQVWGDETFLNGGDGVRIASETAHRSQQSILDILNTGTTSTSVQDLANQFPTKVRNKKGQLVDLQTWHDTEQRDLCFDTIFDTVHYYLLLTQRITNVSRDQGTILPDPPVSKWSNLHKTALVGGAGTGFDNVPSTVDGIKPITKIVVRSGNIIDQLNVFYAGAATPHGGNGGGESVIQIDSDDYLTEVSGDYGNWFGAVHILQLSFKTKKGKTFGPYGNMGYADNRTPFSLKANGNEVIVGFFGATLTHTDGLTGVSALGVGIATHQ